MCMLRKQGSPEAPGSGWSLSSCCAPCGMEDGSLLLYYSVEVLLLGLFDPVTPALVLEFFLFLLRIHNPLFATETYRFYISLAAKSGLNWLEAFYSHYLSHSVWLFICFSTTILMSLITTWGCFIRYGFYRSSLSHVWKLFKSETYLVQRVSDRTLCLFPT